MNTPSSTESITFEGTPIPAPLPPLGERAAAVYGHIVDATRAYVERAGFADVVLGLSGGIDSALVATIAVDAFGPSHVRGVLMPSQHSSSHSLTDAADLAARLGIETMTIPIRPVYEAFATALASAEGYRGAAGVAEENLQARIRGTLLMTLSNRHGWFVLATGNKSEAYAGYATLHGDMVGGYAPLAPLYKGYVYELAAYRNSCAGTGGYAAAEPIPASCIAKEPSAELRPGQLDRHSLPDYPALDSVLHLVVDEGRTPEQLEAMGYDPELIREVGRLVAASAFKRAVAAPGPDLPATGGGSGE